MPRANRIYVPNQMWHITHRCHDRAFLLKFKEDRDRWLDTLYECVCKYGLSVLNYNVTYNHIHLLVYDSQKESHADTIPRSIQRIAGITAQEYNRRKNRKGAFWDDRYHATAVDTSTHLNACLTYIDLNMVRAQAVTEPYSWEWSGIAELCHRKDRNRRAILDLNTLFDFTSCKTKDTHCKLREQWIETALGNGLSGRNPVWTESVAVGRLSFVESIQEALGYRAIGRHIENPKPASSENDTASVLKEPQIDYYPDNQNTENLHLYDNTRLWNIFP